jgi:hypothetical protein
MMNPIIDTITLYGDQEFAVLISPATYKLFGKLKGGTNYSVLSDPKFLSTHFSENMSFDVMGEFLWCALKVGAYQAKKPFNLTVEQVQEIVLLDSSIDQQFMDLLKSTKIRTEEQQNNPDNPGELKST